MDNLQRNLDEIIQRVESARLKVSKYHLVKIVCISKYATANEIKALYELGQRAFGENKVQDFQKKQTELLDLPIEWHFVGRLQKYKINLLIE